MLIKYERKDGTKVVINPEKITHIVMPPVIHGLQTGGAPKIRVYFGDTIFEVDQKDISFDELCSQIEPKEMVKKNGQNEDSPIQG